MKNTKHLLGGILTFIFFSCSDNKNYEPKSIAATMDKAIHKSDTSFSERFEQLKVDTLFYNPSLIPDSEFVIPCKIKDVQDIAKYVNHYSLITHLYSQNADIVFAHINSNKDIYIEYYSDNDSLEIGNGPIIIIIRKSLRKACLIHCSEFTPFGKTFVQFYDLTPYVSTSLNKETINKILPSFSGKYRNITVDSIMLDYNNKYFSIRNYSEYRNQYYKSSKQGKKNLFYESIRIYSKYRINLSESDFGISI